MAKKNKNKDKNERLPYNIVKDSQNYIRVKVDDVSKRYSRIPKHLRSSMIIVIGIFAIVLIAIYANPGTPEAELEPQQAQPLSRLTDVIINDQNQFQAQVPDVPTARLTTDSISFAGQVQQVTVNPDTGVIAPEPEPVEEEEVQTTMSVVGNPEEARSTPKEDALPSFKMIYPLRRQGALVTNYGWYHHPLLEVWRYHQGVDIRCKIGDLVMAVASGKVTQVVETDHEAVLVTIEHANGWKTIYGQIVEVSVQPGAQVSKGQQIGFIGQSQTAYEPHLHFEVHYENESIDPRKFLP